MSIRTRIPGLLLVLTGALTATVLAGVPGGTAFTYQGQLKSGGQPVSDACDLLFSIWTAPSGGVQVGNTSFASGIAVVNGLFGAEVDVGVEPFTGEDIWLQVGVRCPAGGGTFTTLSQRQFVTAAPFSLHTRGIAVDAGGNVGIGTTVPANKLTVHSTDISTLRLVGPTSVFGYGDRLNFGDGEYAFIEEDEDDRLNFQATRFAFSAGRVGIGRTDPQARLDVVSSGETGMRAVTDWIGVYGIHEGGGTFPGVWGETDSIDAGSSGVRGYATATSGGGSGVLGKSSSPSGIGVSAENTANGTALAALGNGSFREQATLRVENTQPNSGMAAYIKSQGTFAAMHLENSSSGQVLWLQNDGEGDFLVAFDTSRGQSQFWVDKNGKTNVRVLQIHGGADLSEKFDVSAGKREDATGPAGVDATPSEESANPAPGMVVVIDPDNPGKLRISQSAYDTTVAGVISGAGGVLPGMVLGQDGSVADGEHPVALSGRVYCLCDASNSPIRPGDLLTTSSTPGHAMKVMDQGRAQGAILGKAMTGLEVGQQGLILVLVSLQ